MLRQVGALKGQPQRAPGLATDEITLGDDSDLVWDGTGFIPAAHADQLFQLKFLGGWSLLVAAPTRLLAVERGERLARARRWPSLRVATTWRTGLGEPLTDRVKHIRGGDRTEELFR